MNRRVSNAFLNFRKAFFLRLKMEKQKFDFLLNRESFEEEILLDVILNKNLLIKILICNLT